MKVCLTALLILQNVANSSHCQWKNSVLPSLIWTNPLSQGSPVLVTSSKVSNCAVSLIKSLKTTSGGQLLKISHWNALPHLTPEPDTSDINFIAETYEIGQEIINMVTDQRLGRGYNVFILTSVTESMAMSFNTDKISVDQKVFLVSLHDLAMLEAYTINGLATWNKVGRFKHQGKAFEFDRKWTGITRTNLYGVYLTIITEHAPPYIALDPNYKTKAPLMQTNQTYDVTGLTSGLYNDIVSELASDLNFTYKAFKRKVENWGTEIDGKPTGMLSNFADGSADLIMADFTMTVPRAKYCNHVPALTPVLYAIAIKSDIEVEEFGIDTFTSPLDTSLWIAMLMLAFVFTALLFVMNNSKGSFRNVVLEKVLGILNWLWTSITANFGAPPMFTDLENELLSNRIVFFTCILAGFVAWMAYQAALTSALATIKVQPPFDSLDTLLKTDFK